MKKNGDMSFFRLSLLPAVAGCRHQSSYFGNHRLVKVEITSNRYVQNIKKAEIFVLYLQNCNLVVKSTNLENPTLSNPRTKSIPLQ